MKFIPSPIGFIGGPLPQEAQLATSICPECPWRKETGWMGNVAMAQDYSMMEVALTGRNTKTLATTLNPTPEIERRKLVGMRQGCHMRLDQRCRGAECFRANAGLTSEAERNNIVCSSEEEMIRIWRSRGSSI